jgi:hypothetical protein
MLADGIKLFYLSSHKEEAPCVYFFQSENANQQRLHAHMGFMMVSFAGCRTKTSLLGLS